MDIITIDSVNTGWWYLVTALGVAIMLGGLVSKRFIDKGRSLAEAFVAVSIVAGFLVFSISLITIDSHTHRLVEERRLNALETQLEVTNIERQGDGFIGSRDGELVYATLTKIGDNRYLVEWRNSN